MTTQRPAMPPMDFKGKKVLVTGGTSGIGKAIAIKFLELNATVIVLSRNVAHLEELVREYPSIQTVTADLGNWDKTRQAVEAVLPIHHLANNAGFCSVMPFLDVDLNHIDTLFDVNFKGALNVAQVVAKGMIANNILNGTIVNTSSIADVTASKNVAIYCATKAALTMLTKSMAVELAPHGIRVNCVSPGLVNTELIASLSEDNKKNGFGPFYDRKLFKEITEPAEVADAVVFLSSTMASGITATRLVVDQGVTAT